MFGNRRSEKHHYAACDRTGVIDDEYASTGTMDLANASTRMARSSPNLRNFS
jgi:hypothetical protein